MTQSIQLTSTKHYGLKQQFAQTLRNIDQIQHSDLFEEFEREFNRIYSKIKKSTKYRNSNLIFPPILYMFLKTKAIVVNRNKFTQWFQIQYPQLMKDMKHLIPFYPDFKNRDKAKLIFVIIEDIAKYYNLHEHFIDNAIILYNYFYPLLQFTSEELSAGVILILTLIASRISSPSMKKVCERICIPNGSISNKINSHIIPKLDIPDFRSLIYSAEILREKLRSLMALQPVPCSKSSSNNIQTRSYSLDPTKLHEQSHLLLNNIIKEINKNYDKYELLSRTEFFIRKNLRKIRKNINYFIRLLIRRGRRRGYRRIVGVAIAFACPRASLVDISRFVGISGSSTLSDLFQKISCNVTFSQFSRNFPYFDYHYTKEVFRVVNHKIRILDLDINLESSNSNFEEIKENIESASEIANQNGLRTREPMIVAVCISLTNPQLHYNDIRELMRKTLNYHVNHTTFSTCLNKIKMYLNSQRQLKVCEQRREDR